MKKMIALCAVMLAVVAAKADFTWSWWTDSPKIDDAKGCVLGIASDVKSMQKGAQISIVHSKAGDVTSGCQYAIGYSRAAEVRRAVQVGTVTRAQRAALQIGLVCFNENGFLPWFVFFNFSRGCWAAK